MSKTSSKVKDRYNAKAYDRIVVRVKKGEHDVIAAYAAQRGESLNRYINRLIAEDMRRSKE